MDHYDHTQRGMLHWLLVGVATVMAVAAVTTLSADATSGAREIPAFVAPIVGAAALLMAGLAPCFAHLRVHDAGGGLAIAFGPWRLFHRRVPYAEVCEVKVGRSALIDGWGIHRIPGRGWTWNIHGFAAVQLTLRGGGRLRIGTDDGPRLAAHLRARCRLGEDQNRL